MALHLLFDLKHAFKFWVMILSTALLFSCNKGEDVLPPSEPVDQMEQIREALIDFYKATDGDNWSHNDNWCSDKPISEWYGVICSQNYISLRLNDNNLKGNIPASLAEIKTLYALYLSENQLSGAIPTELGELTTLNILLLHSNNLEGNIPASLSQLKQLTTFTVSGNKLSGEMPQGLRDLTWFSDFRFGPQQEGYGVTNFEMHENAEEKAIVLAIIKATFGEVKYDDDDMQFSLNNAAYNGHGKVTRLILRGRWGATEDEVNPNKFNLPSDIGKLTELRLLALANFSDIEFPSTFADLTQLTDIKITRCGLTTLSPLFRQLKKLEILDVQYNPITGSIPAWLGELSQLRKLNLNKTKFSGKIPTELSNLKNLVTLNIRNEGEMDSQPFPMWLIELPNIRSIILYRCSVTGEIPEAIGNLKFLINLELSKNKLSGRIPEGIRNLKNLITLDLAINQLSGPLPSWISELDQLREVSFGSNKFTGSIPIGFGNMGNLSFLSFANNQFSGTLPADIGTISHLGLDVYVQNNNLSGMIPDTWFQHTNFASWVLTPQNEGYGFNNYTSK